MPNTCTLRCIFEVSCDQPDCRWTQRHDSQENAYADARAHFFECHAERAALSLLAEAVDLFERGDYLTREDQAARFRRFMDEARAVLHTDGNGASSSPRGAES